MAEYIDREALLELINEDCKYKHPTNEYTRGCNDVCEWAIRTIENIPTADVVPKSEVYDDHHKQVACYTLGCREGDKIKQKVAREIIKHLVDFVDKKETLVQRYCETAYYVNSDDLTDFIAELKKKYTEIEK